MTEYPGVLDYSFQHPDLDLVGPSVKGVARYLRGGGTKQLTADEVSDIHRRGLFIVLNDEVDPDAPHGGYPAGVRDGQLANAAAVTVGAPFTCVIHPSIDFDVTTKTEFDLITEYLNGYHMTNRFGDGVYGEMDVLDAAYAAGLLTTGYGWQASAWSNGRTSPHAAMLQYLNGQNYAGGVVDFNRIIHEPGLGAWYPPQRKAIDMTSYHGNDGKGSTYVFGDAFQSKKHLLTPAEEAGAQLAIKAGAMVEIGALTPEFIQSIPDAGTVITNVTVVGLTGSLGGSFTGELHTPPTP